MELQEKEVRREEGFAFVTPPQDHRQVILFIHLSFLVKSWETTSVTGRFDLCHILFKYFSLSAFYFEEYRQHLYLY